MNRDFQAVSSLFSLSEDNQKRSRQGPNVIRSHSQMEIGRVIVMGGQEQCKGERGKCLRMQC